MIISNSALRASLGIYHLISNARSWNNCSIFYISGGMAGLSMIFYRSSTIALYLASKMFEVKIGWPEALISETLTFGEPFITGGL